MRIVVANALGTLAGGTETFLRHLIPALCARGHEVAFLQEFPVSGTPLLETGAASVTWCVSALTVPGTMSAVARWRPDVILVNGLYDIELEERLVDAHPAVLFAHAYYGTCATGEKRFRFPHSVPCSRPLSTACLALNYALGCGMRNPVRLLRSYLSQARRRGLLPRYRAILVASRHMSEELLRNGATRRVVVVNPLWSTGMQPTPTPPSRRAATGRIAYLGRLTRVKGPAAAFEAVRLAARRLVRPLRLVVGGDGPERGRLASLAARHHQLELLGWVDGERRTGLLSGSDALVLPSLWPEPFGLVGLEAGAVGTPSVAFDAGGIREWLVPGLNGEVAAPFSVASLADALVRALADPERHHRLRTGAWHEAQRFTRERHVEITERVLEQAAARTQERRP